MKRKTPEIRAAAVHAVLDGKLSVESALSVFSISKSSLYRWIKIYKDEGRILHKTSPGRSTALTQEDLERIKAVMAEQPDITLAELSERLSLPVCIATIHNYLIRLGYGYKKKHSKHPNKSGKM